MKKLKIVLFSVVALGLTFASCSNDDDKKDNNMSGTLEGKWIYAKSGLVIDGKDFLADYTHQEGCSKDYVEIIAGGAYKDVEYWGSECEENADTTTWKRNGNSFTVGTGEEQLNGTIEKLTNSELKIKVTEIIEGEPMTYATVFTKG